MNSNSNNINWNEKYRPNNITSIILSKYNKLLIDNILGKNYFPNLLLYGPPGTGKTTTIMNFGPSKNKLSDTTKLCKLCLIISIPRSSEALR